LVLVVVRDALPPEVEVEGQQHVAVRLRVS